MSEKVTEVPRYGLKRKLNHKYPEKWTQGYLPKLNQIPALIGLILRWVQFNFSIDLMLLFLLFSILDMQCILCGGG